MSESGALTPRPDAEELIPPPSPQEASLGSACLRLVRDAVRLSWDLFKIMVPVSIVVRVLDQTGVIAVLGDAISPVMKAFGLPGSMGLVWATSLVTNIYGGMAAYAALSLDNPLTTAQVTIVGTMILIAHSLPVECGITRQAGPRLRAVVVLRLGAALLAGWLLHLVYSATGWHAEPSAMMFTPQSADPSWTAWTIATAQRLGVIFLIILGLLVLMRILDRIGFTCLAIALLKPLLRLLGISAASAPVTIVGMTLGLTYGGGLIIGEARSGHIKPRDVFYSLALMSIAHSLIEDTLLMTSLGAHALGTLGMRVVVALVITALLVRIIRHVPDQTFYHHLFVPRGRDMLPDNKKPGPPAGMANGPDTSG